MNLLIVLAVFVVFLVYHLYWKRRNLPPGPIPLPFLGNILALRNPAPGFRSFVKWRKTYGDIYTFWLGTRPYILVSSYEALKETFIRDGETYVDKKPMPFQESFRGGCYGVVETNGMFWREHRRFALHQFRDFGYGKERMQQRILIEVEDIFNSCDNSQGEDINIVEKMDRAVGNVINQMLFGYRFDASRHEEFKTIRGFFDFQKGEFNTFKMRMQFLLPWTGRFMTGPTILERFEKYRVGFSEFFGRQIEQHKNEIDFELDETTDYVEAYLKEQRKREKDGDFETYSNTQLFNMCLDLWFAGLTTMSNTLQWCFAYVLNYPQFVAKVHEEMDRVIQGDRLITMDDKNNLPYMNAFINECQRCANVVPLNLLHMTTKDTVINGYSIPKGTGVVAQISTAMLDERVFKNPDAFNPDRFIANGKLRKIDELVPFSVGKRQCLGEGMARMELFLFVANFLNRYHIRPTKEGVPCVDHDQLGSMHTKPYKIVVERRRRDD
ncbi:unnamed protein product [Caenorhabditis bovis]|uniref:CYtochrome P450 family n=1 Tax=Caenorhabditis bovis TaxID=2654633 RepID=A0A8S1EET8_9PELO|nr:unnamed protein product [Caenorhabditis bovis]